MPLKFSGGSLRGVFWAGGFLFSESFPSPSIAEYHFFTRREQVLKTALTNQTGGVSLFQ
jgi:hypothetical protein